MLTKICFAFNLEKSYISCHESASLVSKGFQDVDIGKWRNDILVLVQNTHMYS